MWGVVSTSFFTMHTNGCIYTLVAAVNEEEPREVQIYRCL